MSTLIHLIVDGMPEMGGYPDMLEGSLTLRVGPAIQELFSDDLVRAEFNVDGKQAIVTGPAKAAEDPFDVIRLVKGERVIQYSTKYQMLLLKTSDGLKLFFEVPVAVARVGICTDTSLSSWARADIIGTFEATDAEFVTFDEMIEAAGKPLEVTAR